MIEETLAGPTRVATAGGLPRRYERRWFGALRRIPWAIAPFVLFLMGIIVVALLAPLLVPHDPTGQSLRTRLLAPALLGSGNPAYLLGTDYLGRDILSRIIFGSQVSLVVGVAGLATAGVFGSLVGLVAGYRRGPLDEALMALADVQLAFPNVLLAIAVIAVLGPNLLNLVLVLGLTGWVTYARVARGSYAPRTSSRPSGAWVAGMRGSCSATFCRTAPRCWWSWPRCTWLASSSWSRRSASSAWASSRRRQAGAA